MSYSPPVLSDMHLTRLEEIVSKGDRTRMPNFTIPAKAERGLSLEEMKQFVKSAGNAISTVGIRQLSETTICN